MSRQTTLNAHFRKKDGSKISPAPPVQGDIREMMKKGQSTKSKRTKLASDELSGSGTGDLATAPNGGGLDAEMVIDSKGELADAEGAVSTGKRRLVVEDGDEEIADENTTNVSNKDSAIFASASDEAAPPAAKRSKICETAAVPSKGRTTKRPKIEDSETEDDNEDDDDHAASSGEGGEDAEHDEEKEEEEEEEEEEEIAAQEQKKAHKKLAAIFTETAKASTSTAVKWKEGTPVPYAALIEAFVKVEATSKRLVIAEIITTLFAKVIKLTPGDMVKVVYLCINRLCPDYEGLELGIGDSILHKAIAQSTGRNVAQVKKEHATLGDLGDVAVASRKKQPTMFATAALTVPLVFKNLKEIAQTSGSKSQDKKIGIIKKLLASCKGQEAKFLIRSLTGKLRIGLAQQTILVALGQAVVLAEVEKSGKNLGSETLAARLEASTETVKAVYSELPSYDVIIPVLLKDGYTKLKEQCKLTPGVPLKPMLAKPSNAISQVLDRFEGKKFVCEYKYDGERAQVHYKRGGLGSDKKHTLAVFSRNSEDMSLKYPDLVDQVSHCIKDNVESFVLDAEATAWRKECKDANGVELAATLLPFQQLTTRKRKNVEVGKIEVSVKLFGFDLLYLNGQPLLHHDLESRRNLLRENFHAVPDEFDFAQAEECTTVDDIQRFLLASIEDGTEGLMVKMLEGSDATYEPSRRSMNWLKLKKDYLAGSGDSVDLVVIGAYHGRGKRTAVYGAFLLATYDEDSEEYQSICKIGTGFSEENLNTFYTELHAHETTTKKGYYSVGDAKPDVYFEPKVVWEVKFADLTISPVYANARGLVESRGISLRFPRFVRIRDDKTPDAATSPEQVVDMYRMQKNVGQGGGGDDEY